MQPSDPKYDVGSIYWLLARNKVPIEHLHATIHIDSGCFNHPALILWVNPSSKEVIILLITSFGGTDLALRHPHDTRARSLHLPIYPSNTHPDNGMRLFLKNDARLPSNSYVKIEPQRTVKTVLLVPLRQGVCSLREDSFKELVRHISFHPPIETLHRNQRASNTPNTLRIYGERPKFDAPAAEQRVKPLPARFQQILPPRPGQQQPPSLSFGEYGIGSSPRMYSRQAERAPLLRPVQPVPRATQRTRVYRTPSQARNASCSVGHVVGILVLAVLVWLWWRMASA